MSIAVTRSRVGLKQLLALTLAPVGHSILRAGINMRLSHSAMSVAVLRRQIKNDQAALSIAYSLPSGPAIAKALRQQIDDANADILTEHALQADLNSRLAALR